MDEMVWGIENFLQNEYKAWYRQISKEMENRRVYEVKDHLLVKKNLDKCFEKLFFVSKREGSTFPDSSHDFLIEGFNPDEHWKSAELKVLHPEIPTKYLTKSDKVPTVGNDSKYWEIKPVTEEYYYGEDLMEF